MSRARLGGALVCLAASLAANAFAQKPVPTLYLAPGLRLEGPSLRIGGDPPVGTVRAGPDGRIITAPEFLAGVIRAFDSTGKSLGWNIPVGGRDTDIGWVDRLGWTGSSAWISDMRFSQVVPIDAQGKLGKSIPFPTWVRPTWAERRKYPLFGRLQPLAVYADHSMLVKPSSPRSLLDTPGFDRSITHLLRIDADGVIQREIAQFDEAGGRITITGDGRAEHTMTAPFYAYRPWSVSPDGQRVVIVIPAATSQDSGFFRVVAIGEKGDTIFSRRYPCPSVRVTNAMADSALATVQGFGGTSAAEVRARLAPRIPAFKSFVTGLYVGADHSAWIVTRPVSDTAKARDALILDEHGEPLASVRMPDNVTPLAVNRARLWGLERGKRALVRFELQAAPPARPTPSRPARSAKASAVNR